MTAPPCDLCSMKSLQAALLEPLWPMPSSTVNATTGTSANRLARRVSFRLNEASRAGRFTECARKCAPLSRPNAIGNAYMSRRSSAQSNANSRPKHRAVRSLPSANKLSCSAWPTISTNSGHFILDFHFMPELSAGGCWIFAAAAALLVGQRSMKDILPPRALPQRQIFSNAPVPYL